MLSATRSLLPDITWVSWVVGLLDTSLFPQGPRLVFPFSWSRSCPSLTIEVWSKEYGVRTEYWQHDSERSNQAPSVSGAWLSGFVAVPAALHLAAERGMNNATIHRQGVLV